MPDIIVLDQNTINQIAAGEVIERPASVVKELVENSIDARASSITVEIRDGGIGMIRITDNGCGIPAGQVRTAFMSHATSKIRNPEDLITVTSLGFRGEALSTIAAVARVELITREASAISGTRCLIEGGEEKAFEEIGAPAGTTFIVRDLFFNTPARRKFLKTPSSEAGHIASMVEKIALSHPEIAFRFIQNGQIRLHTTGNRNRRDIIYTVYGREIASNLEEIPAKPDAPLPSVSGFIGKPVICRSSRSFETYFINGRYIRSPLIFRAIEDAYKPYMMQHKFPFVMLDIRIEPEMADVNVHPSKMELRFRNEELIYKTVYHTIRLALAGRELIPDAIPDGDERAETAEDSGAGEPQRQPAAEAAGSPVQEGRASSVPLHRAGLSAVPFRAPEAPKVLRESRGPEPFETRRLEAATAPEAAADMAAKETALPDVPAATEGTSLPDVPLGTAAEETAIPQAAPKPQASSKPSQMDFFEAKLLDPASRKRHTLIGQVFDTYWLVEYDDNLYIIDQHAAHEKVLYERTMKTLKTRTMTSQAVNPPIILTLTQEEIRILEQYSEAFERLGFEIEPFGSREYAVRAVPDNLFSLAKKDLLLEMLDSLTAEGGMKPSETLDHHIATMSCKAAVKGGNRLSRMEADALIDELLTLENPYHCPHGRPTIIRMSRYELEKKFKRIV